MAKLIEQGMISSISDLTKLGIIDFNRTNGHWDNDPYQAMTAISKWLIGLAAYTVIEVDLRQSPEREDWPGWNHIGSSHEYLGRLYWNCFFNSFEKTNRSPELHFSDMPDFTGSIIDSKGIKRQIYGDIGQVSASTFATEVLRRIRKNDMWISVIGEKQQIIIEPSINIGETITKAMLDTLFPRLRKGNGI